MGHHLKIWTLGVVVFGLIPVIAHAEYRLFELAIQNAETGQERIVVSNLDPQQYRRYHPTVPTETITYRRTWMCRGDTSGFRPGCSPPQDQE